MLRKLLVAMGVLLAFCAVSLVAARLVIAYAARDKTYSDVSAVPHRHVGLVLGCPKRVFGGWPNPFFESRIAAAAELYHHGKVDYLVASGDNHLQGYDEPSDMKNALLDKGVPADRIYLDYAGLRTLDSVVRVKEIFGQGTSPSFRKSSTFSARFSSLIIMASMRLDSQRPTWRHATLSKLCGASNSPR